jgi:predicted nucleic-acid-binding protein
MIALDTNVIVRYLVQDDPAQAAAANDLFSGLTAANPGYIGLVAWAEAYWVLTRTYGFSRADALATLRDLAGSDEIASQDEPQVTRALTLAQAGADFGDALIMSAATAAGCAEAVTFDKRAAARLGYRLL